MRTSRRILQDAQRAIATAIVFSGFMALLTLAIPLFILHVLQSVAIADNLDKLLALGAITAAALAAALALEAARNTLLLRAGLWLDHELGQQVLAQRVSAQPASAPLSLSKVQLRQVVEALVRGEASAWADALWVPTIVLAMALIHPLLGLLAFGFMAGSLLLGWASFRNKRDLFDREMGSQVTSDEAWMSALYTRPSHAARDAWELANRSSVASAYAIERQSAFVRSATRCLGSLTLVLLAIIGADLFTKDVIASPAIAAAIILMMRLSAITERANSSIPAYLRTRRAWRALNRIASEDYAADSAAVPPFHFPVAQADFELGAFVPELVEAAPAEARMN